MPWWLGLPVLVVWGFVLLGIYTVIGLSWLIWLLGHSLAQLSKGTQDGATARMPATSSAPPTSSLPPRRMLLTPDLMNAEVPEYLANLRSRYQAELDATSALPDQMSRLQAELDIRKRFGAAMDASLEIWMASASPELLARYEPLIRAQRVGARRDSDTPSGATQSS
jgi:hypothetical protein